MIAEQNTSGARVVAIANQKGGVGKTTTAVSLSAALTLLGKRVLLIDLDPHACASVHLRFYSENIEGSINNIFVEDALSSSELWKPIICHHDKQNFDVVPATIRLSELEVDLRNRKGKGAILREKLEYIRSQYDFIILDCPPHVGILLVNALVACNLLVIPIQTDFLALHGLTLLFDTIRMLNKILPSPIVYRVLPTLYDRRAKACSKVLELLSAKMADKMFVTSIGMDTNFRDASAQGRVIFEIAPNSRGAIAYGSLAKEILALG